MAKKPFIGCSLKILSDPIKSAALAVAENPANQPQRRYDVFAALPPKLALAVMTKKYWKTGGVDLTFGFFENVSQAFRDRLASHFNSAGEFANIKARWTNTSPQVRITFAKDGYWSYPGTDILGIPRTRPTMNLQDFTMQTPEAEWKRVVRHEWLHTCGCPHEHSRLAIVNRLNEQKTIEYFKRTQGWTEAEIRQQILTPISEASLIATPEAEEDSLMAYWFPGEITKDGRPILGGKDFTALDKTLLAKVYPLSVQPPPPPGEVTIVVPEAGTYVKRQ